MPPRVARSNTKTLAPKTAKNKNRKRNLDAFAIASHSAPAKNRIKSSRLGEFLDDRPRQKRRRNDGDDEESEDDEDAPPKRRRAVPQNEDEEEGSDSSGNEWTLGGLKEDDSDSELDSDEAFGESDEEKFEGFTFRGSKSVGGKKKKSKPRSRVEEYDDEGIDLEEGASAGEDEEEDDFGEEGVDLATMLDDEGEEMLGGKDTTHRDRGEESASDEDEEEESDLQAESDSSDEEGDEEERVARMRDRIDALDASTQPSKTAATNSQPAALTVEDLLADLDPAQRKQFVSAIKTKKKSEQPKTLSAPLPKRQQDKLNREEASKKAKGQLDRWKDTVIRNRRAEFLSFPLNDPSRENRAGKDRFVVGEEQVPANELEENIRKIMEESGLATKPGQKPEDEEDMLLKAEELATNKMPVDEVIQRRAELRRARELLFREEIKAKRIKKIKSKAYRRVHRRERMRLEKEEHMLRELHGEADIDEDEQERYERKRAEARMNTKHRDSKFGKSLNQTNRVAWDDGAREAVIDEARRREELKRRVHGEEVDRDDDNSDVPSGDDDASDGEDEDGVTLKQLSLLGRDERKSEAKGLGAMKFMRAADEQQRAQNEEDIERLRKDMAVEDGDEEESDSAVDDQGLGRAIFGPKGQEERSSRDPKAKKPELEEGNVTEDEEDEAVIVTDKPGSGTEAKQGKTTTASAPLAKGLQFARAKEATEQDVSRDGWLGGPAKKDRKRKGAQDVNATIDMDLHTTNAKENQSHKEKSKPESETGKKTAQSDSQANNTNGWTLVPYQDEENDGSDTEPTNPILTAAQQKANLFRSAFATDDATKSTFDAEKDQAAASEDEQELSTHLPGWGSWAGHGLTRSDKKAHAHRKHNPLYKTKVPGVKREDRKDAKLENVIISEKQNRKGKHYMAPMLPHGYETKAQYERALRLPMGPEWSTKEVFQRATRPRVVVKTGAVVEAMERPLV